MCGSVGNSSSYDDKYRTVHVMLWLLFFFLSVGVSDPLLHLKSLILFALRMWPAISSHNHESRAHWFLGLYVKMKDEGMWCC